MSGKTTLATTLASKFEYNCISTDDIGEILQTVIDINPMKGFDYREYYIKKSVDELNIEAWEYHKKISPAIKHLIEIHSKWGMPIIIEGWALYPSFLENITNKNIRKIWLIGDLDVLRRRLINETAFYQGASNEKLMISKYLQRSMWHNEKIFNDVRATGEYIKITNDLTKDDLLKTSIQILDKSF